MNWEKICECTAMNLFAMTAVSAIFGRIGHAVLLWFISVFLLGCAFGIKSAKEER